MMDYETSSQARSWLFDRETLNLCHDMRTSGVSGNENGAGVRNFASGLHRRIREQRIWDTSIRASLKRPCDNETPKDALSETEKAAILRFHGNQIQALVGPRAIYPDLKTSPKVLATAIMLYRRFYLSNDVLDSDCRHIATASALLASKVEPDEQIDIGLLSLATIYIQRKAQYAAVYGAELRAVSTVEIEKAERLLLEGLNYELICHHPTDAVQVLGSDLTKFFREKKSGYLAKNSVELGEEIYRRALAVCYRSLVCSEAPFLFTPGKIAFAATKLALHSIRCGELTGKEMGEFLRVRFPGKTDGELEVFEREASAIVLFLKQCPPMELDLPQSCKGSSPYWNEAEELWNALTKLSNVYSFAPPPSSGQPCKPVTKRRRLESQLLRESRSHDFIIGGCPKVTPSLSYC